MYWYIVNQTRALSLVYEGYHLSVGNMRCRHIHKMIDESKGGAGYRRLLSLAVLFVQHHDRLDATRGL